MEVKTMDELQKKYDDLLVAYEAAMKIVRSTYPDKFPDNYFICGEIGCKDSNNLPDKLMICPAYGCDWFQIYQKTDATAGPEY
jgi:hypothetical protein